MEIYESMLKQNEKNKDVVGDEDNPNVYNSVNLPKKIDYSFLHNDIFNLLTQLDADKYSVSKTIESLCLANEFLKKYNWVFLPEENTKTGQLFIKHVLLNFTEEEIYSLKKKIESSNLLDYENENEIRFNTINPIRNFITDDTNSNKKVEYLMWRKIRGDGNSFYRTILFAFFENIILSKNINFLKNFIVDFKLKLKNPLLISMAKENKIDLHETFKCLIIIYFSMTSKSRDPTTKSYSVLIKMFNNISDFDKGLIAYYRILIYTYIDNNREKTLSEDFPIFLGNLLPSEYKNMNGKYDYDSFFENYLFKFHQLAERIVMYVTPFILGYNIEILYVDNINDINKPNNCRRILLDAGNFNLKENKIIILYKQTHYDLIYSYNYVKKYRQFLFLDYVSAKSTLFCYICKSPEKRLLARFKKLGKKEVFICVKCMIKEIKYYIRNLLLYFIQKQKRFFLSRNHEIIKNFLDCNIIIGNLIEIHIKDAIYEVDQKYENFTFEGIVRNIKNSLCIFCHRQINSKNKFKLILPCGCNICSHKCIKDFYQFVLSSMVFKEHMICFCGEVYEPWEVHNFVKNLNNIQINCNELLNFYLKNNKDKCYICFQKSNDVIKCEIIDNDFTINNKVIHHICKKCLDNIEKSSLFRCNFCSADHKFNKIVES